MGIALIIGGIFLIAGAGIFGVLNMAGSQNFDAAFRRHAVVMVVAFIGWAMVIIGLVMAASALP